MHLRLIKGLSYDGVVRASAAHPDVFVDDPEKYTALLESGYFEALPDAHTVTGHLDADFLGEMDEEQLDKLADEGTEVKAVDGQDYYVLDNSAFKALAGKNSLSLKKALKAQGLLLCNGDRYDYRETGSSSGKLYIVCNKGVTANG